MAIENFKLADGSTLEVTTINKSLAYHVVTKKIIPPVATVPNKLPMVSAGTDKTIKLPISEVTLIGVVSDSDGRIVSHKWEKLGGPACTIVSPTSLATKVTGMVEGAYTFRLSATDDKGGIAADDLIVTVQKADPIVIPPTTKVNYLALEVVGPQDFSGKTGIRFENKRIRNAPGVGIKMYNGANDIIIRNCFFDGSLGELVGELVETENAYNILIENCLFARGLTGVYNVGSKGIKIINCQFINMRMTPSYSRGQFVQFNSSSDGLVENCKGENWLNESNPEDQISCYASSNVVIRNNMFRGGGPSSSGGGIIIGDNGGNNCLAEYNTLLNPGQYGMAVAGGTNMQILNNKIFGERFSWSNNPLYVWNQHRDNNGNLIPMVNVTVKGNRLSWIDRDGNVNPGWNAGNGSNIIWENPTGITKAEMNVPAHLIDFVTPEQLLTIRK